MTSKIKKEAVIRSNEDSSCPYGLPINCACQNVGELIQHLAPVDINIVGASNADDREDIAKANNHLFIWQNPGERCPFAETLIDKNQKVVECSWSPDTAGYPEPGALLGSPYFYKHFSGIGTDGLYSYPLGYYAESSIDRNMYMGGVYNSLASDEDEENIKK